MFITKKTDNIQPCLPKQGKQKTTVHKEHLIESVSFYRYEKGQKRLAAYCHKITASVKKTKNK